MFLRRKNICEKNYFLLENRKGAKFFIQTAFKVQGFLSAIKILLCVLRSRLIRVETLKINIHRVCHSDEGRISSFY